MLSSACTAVYKTAVCPSPRFVFLFLILFLSFLSSAEARDESAEHSVRMLARRVSAEMQHSKMNCVNWNNYEAVSEPRSQQLKSVFLEELQSKQGDLQAGQGACGVSVFLERTPAQVVVTAEMESGTSKQYLLAEISRAELPAEGGAAPAPHLQKELVWQNSERILDALIVHESGASERLLVLRKDALLTFEKQSGVWKLLQTRSLGEASATQRAPRGELHYSPEQPDRLKIVLPGKTCQTTFGESGALNCQSGVENWRTGMLLTSPCEQQAWWLYADGGDSTAADRLQLGNPSLPLTQTPLAELGMPGPVLSISSGENLRADTAVVFNLATGNYEVYRIALACGT